MEKERNTKKKTKSSMTKAKKIRSLVMMTLLCVMLLSAATYAWFTLSNTAKATNLTMKVGDVTGLQIAEDKGSTPAESDWGSSLSFEATKGTLMPATTTDGIAMKKPVYGDDGGVTSVDAATDADKLTKASTDNSKGYWIERTFYLRARGKSGVTTKVKLADGEGIGSDGIWKDSNANNGTYVLSKEAGTSGILPGAAVRMSFQNGTGTSAAVLEPNSDYNTGASQKATDSSNSSAVASTVTQTMAGVCTFAQGSDNILELTNNEASKITLRMWIEGTDDQCGNEIAAKDIVSQLKFITVE